MSLTEFLDSSKVILIVWDPRLPSVVLKYRQKCLGIRATLSAISPELNP